MSDDLPSPFRNTSLQHFSLQGRCIIRLATLSFPAVIKVLGTLTRFEVRGLEHFQKIAAAGYLPILVYWHDRIVLDTHYFRNRGLVSLISLSLDGEYIARVVRIFGFGAVRGSSSRGGKEALNGMVEVMHAGHATTFAVDGPRGPRYTAKIGPVILAMRTGNPVLPCLVEAKHQWTLPSWDRLCIARPFSPALVLVGEPIYVPSDADDALVHAKLGELQQSLDSLVERGREWRERP